MGSALSWAPSSCSVQSACQRLCLGCREAGRLAAVERDEGAAAQLLREVARHERRFAGSEGQRSADPIERLVFQCVESLLDVGAGRAGPDVRGGCRGGEQLTSSPWVNQRLVELLVGEKARGESG